MKVRAMHSLSAPNRSDVVTGLSAPGQGNGLAALDSYAQNGRLDRNRYLRWYFGLIVGAQERDIPRCYSEVHHILPRSMGGGDEASNLVRLTYREHFLAHWLLTRFCVGGDLRKMQRALFAMTLKVSGERVTSGWQFEIAKRAVRDLEIDPAIEAAWYERYEAEKAAKKQQLRAMLLKDMAEKERLKARVIGANMAGLKPEEICGFANEFLHAHRRHRKHPRKGGGRKGGPFISLIPGETKEERRRNYEAMRQAALANNA
jgi:hypothetical protein